MGQNDQADNYLILLLNSGLFMASKRDGVYHKSVSFGGKTMTLYSLDGLTWSSRKDELQVIEDRREAQKVTAAQLKGELPAEGAAPAAKPAPAPLRPRPQLSVPKEKVEHPAETLIRAQKKQEKQDKQDKEKAIRARASVKAAPAKAKPAKVVASKKAKAKKSSKKKLAA